MVLYFEACLGDIVPASSEKYRAILPSASEWPHVFTLFLRPLQPLAQALDVFIVRLVLLSVHFQQRPQDFDPMLFLHHTLSVFKLAYNSTVSGCFHRFTGFYICVWVKCSPGGGGKSCLAFHDSSSLRTHSRYTPYCCAFCCWL